MYTILPIHQDKMPRSFIFDTIELAEEGAAADFNDPHTPETKGYMIVKVEKAIGVDRTMNSEVSLDDYIQQEET